MTNLVGRYSKRVLAALLSVMMLVSMVPNGLFELKADAAISGGGSDTITISYGGNNYPELNPSVLLTVEDTAGSPSPSMADNYDPAYTFYYGTDASGVPTPTYEWTVSDSSDPGLSDIAYVNAKPNTNQATLTAEDPGSGNVKCVITYTWKAGDNIDESVADKVEFVVKRSYEKRINILDKTTPESLTLSATSQNLVVDGAAAQITATVSPSGFAGEIDYSSSDEEIITVDENGLVTPVAEGSATVTAVIEGDEKSISSTISFTVAKSADPTKATDVEIGESETYALKVGESLPLVAIVKPSTAVLKEVSWTSSDTAVASVTDGLVTALAAGTTVVTLSATTGEDDTPVSKTVAITVSEPEPTPAPEIIIKEAESKTLEIGEVYFIDPELTLGKADSYTYTVSSESPAGCVTADNGQINAVEAGSATVTITAVKDGADIAKKDIHVTVLPEDVIPADISKLDGKEIALAIGGEYNLTAFVTENDGTIEYASAETAIATVADGVIKGISAGTAEVVVTATTGTAVEKVTVKVTVLAEDVIPADISALDGKEIEIVKGSTYDLAPFISESADSTITYASAQAGIAGVDESGVVTAAEVGATEIIVTATTGTAVEKAKVYVTVLPEEEVVTPADISKLEGKEVVLAIDGEYDLTAFVTENDGTIEYASAETAVATVADGVIKGISAGTTEVVVTATTGTAVEKVTVKVTVLPEDVIPADISKLDGKEIALAIGGEYNLTAFVTENDGTIEYASAEAAVADVEDGVVKGIAAGTTEIVVTATTGTAVEKVTVKVTVTPEDADVTPADISALDGKEITIVKGSTYDLAPFISESADSTIDFASAQADIADVDENGIVTAASAGTTEIVVTATTGTAVEKATVKVTVTETVPAALKTGAPEEITLVVGETYDYNAWILANDSAVSFASSTDKAAVDASGVITAVSAGETEVLVTAVTDGISAELAAVKVTVVDYEVNAVKIYLYNTNAVPTEGETGTITAAVKPDDCTDTIIFSSSDESVVSIDPITGEYQALSAGTATVTVTALKLDGTESVSETIDVEVAGYVKHAESIVASIESDVLAVGETTKATYLVQPEDTTDTIQYTVLGTAVTVDEETGSVTAVESGVAYIKVYSVENPKVYDLVSVKVLKSAELDNVPEAITIVEGYTFDLGAHVTLNDDTVTYTVDQSDYITVDENGVVTGLKYTDDAATLPKVHVASVADPTNFVDVEVTVLADETHVKTLDITCEKRELWPSESAAAVLSYTPAETTDRFVYYTSDADVLDINSVTGEFYALKSGEATIFAAAYDVYDAQTAVTEAITIKVLTPSEIEASVETVELDLNTNSYDLASKINFAVSGDDTTVIYTSEDESVAVVDEFGTVKAVGTGITFVTAKVLNNPATDEDDSAVEFVVVVTEDGSYYYLGTETVELKASADIKTTELAFAEAAKEAVLSDLTFTAVSSDSAVADAIAAEYKGENGTANEGVEVAYVAKATGTATITVTNADGFYGYVIVSVTEDPESVVLDTTNVVLWPGNTAAVTAAVLPETAAQTIEWTSNDNAVATVNEFGVITAVGDGATEIVATAENGVYAYVYVTVLKPAETITFEPDRVELPGLDSYDIVAVTVEAADAADKNVTYTVSDGITFDAETGKVTANVKSGIATVTAKIENDPSTDADDVTTVLPVVIGTEPEALDDETIKIGETGSKATELLEKIYDIEVVWTEDRLTYVSTNEAAVTVDSTGTYTGVAAGEALIVATTDTGLVFTWKVTVVNADPTSVELSETEVALWPGHKIDVDASVVPASANQAVIWTSEDDAVAAVDKDGVITAVESGETVVWATPYDAYGSPVNAAAAKVYVKVYEAATAITDAEDEIVQLAAFGDTTTRTVEITEATADDQNIVWVNLNQDLFTVDYDAETKQLKFTAGNRKGVASLTGYIENDPDTEDDDVSITYIVVVGKSAIELGEEIVEVGKTDSKAVLEDEMKSENTGDVITGNFTLNNTGVWVADGYFAGQTLTFTSSNPNYVSVDPDTGVWTGVAPTSDVDEGWVWVIATSSGGTQWIWKVIVVPSTAESIDASIDKSVIWPTETAHITASVNPSTAVQDVEFIVVDETIATVSDKGLITPTGTNWGTTTVLAVALDADGFETDVYAELQLTVLKPATSITFDPNPVELNGENDYKVVKVTVEDSDADDKVIDYVVDEDTIIFNSNTFKVTSLVADGYGTVTAHIENDPNTDIDDVYAVLEVNIGSEIANLDDAVIHIGETGTYFDQIFETLKAIDKNWKEDIKNIDFWTAPSTYATIDDAGTFTGVAVGTSYAFAEVGGHVFTWKIKVVPADPTSIEVTSDTNVTLWPKVGTVVSCNQSQIKASVLPESAPQKLSYTSSDESIITVDANGLVTAIGAGDATVTITAYEYDPESGEELESEVTATVYVTVYQPATALEITSNDPGYEDGELLLTYAGDAAQLIGVVTPEDADDQNIVWWSSDPSVAAVDENGVVTAQNAAGTVEIYGKIVNDPCAAHTKDDVVAYIRVTVVDSSYWQLTVDPESIERYPYDVDTYPNERFNIVATATLKNATSGSDIATPTVTYKVTEGEGIVSVDKNGLVTPLKPGEAVVTSYIFEGTTKEVSAETYITVLQPVTSVGITLKGSKKVITKYEMLKGSTQYFAALFNDGKTTPADTSVTWKMSNTKIATVDKYGKVTAHKVGKTTLYVYANNNLRAECVITVIQLPTKIFINQTSVSIYPNEFAQLTWTLSPSDVSEKKIKWTSSNPAVAKVYSNGNIQAIAPGKCTITATCETRGSRKAASTKIKVTVKQPAKSITLSATSKKLTVGQSVSITATVNSSAHDKSVVWTSTNPGIASVDQFGIVTAHKKGTVYIYATTHNSISAKCKITVKAKSFSSMKGVTAVDGLFVRSGASISDTIIGQIQYAGTAVDIVGQKGEWYKIIYGSGYGWVNSGYVTITDSGNNGNDSAEIRSNAVITAETQIYLGLGVRPHTTAPAGTRVLIIGSSGSYYHITYGTNNIGTGWVLKSAVKKDVGARNGKPTVITVNGVEIDGMGSSYNVVYGGSVVRKAKVINRNSSGVFIYSGINTAYKTYKKLARVFYGENLTVLTDCLMGWYQVQAADGTIGFISGKNIKIKNTYHISRTYSNRGIVNADLLNVRAEPTSDAEIIGLAKKGRELSITGEYGYYYEVNWTDGMGYVLKEYVDLKVVRESSSTGWVNPTFAVVVVKRANVMASSSKNSKVVGSVTMQNKLRVVGAKGNYWRIVTNRGTTGYVLKACVKLTTKTVNIVR